MYTTKAERRLIKRTVIKKFKRRRYEKYAENGVLTEGSVLFVHDQGRTPFDKVF